MKIKKNILLPTLLTIILPQCYIVGCSTSIFRQFSIVNFIYLLANYQLLLSWHNSIYENTSIYLGQKPEKLGQALVSPKLNPL